MKTAKTVNLGPTEPAPDKPEAQDAMEASEATLAPSSSWAVKFRPDRPAIARHYDDVVNQGVPSHFVELLRRLERQDARPRGIAA